ncbi:hypothetical protein D9M70_197040 [compost metagenome]
MTITRKVNHQESLRVPGRGVQPCMWTLALMFAGAGSVQAFEFDTGNEDLTARWDTTLKYSVAQRLKEPSSKLTADANLDDGDRNFDKGSLISNRLDVLSEFDLKYREYGLRLSGAGWYDSVYNDSNDNDSPRTVNSRLHQSDHFADDTEKLHGRKAELLDAFVFGHGEVAEMPVSGRLGKHTVLYGESLFFGNNGIAAAQSPVDIIKLLSVPNTQFKELIRPVEQFSGQIQLRPNLAVGAYYQWRWERSRLPAVGSYFSTADILDGGAEEILAGPNSIIPGGEPFHFAKTSDLTARDSGQFGIQVRYRPEALDVELGAYAARYHAKDPLVYVHPGEGFNPFSGQLGTYQLVFPEDIKTFGFSLSTAVGDTNVGVEVSLRDDMPLIPRGGSVVVPAGVAANNDGHALYPVGKTAHAQVSWITLLSPGPIWDGGSFIGEVAWNRLLSVSENREALEPNASRDATALRMVFEPAYYQVLDGLDVSLPVGLGYGISGRSSVINPGFSVEHGGDLSVGLNTTYLRVWKLGLNYTHFFGGDDGLLTPANGPVQSYSYKQSLKDRDFIALTAQRTF